MTIETFFHAPTWTLTHLVYDPKTLDAFVVDPVLDFDPAAVGITTETVDELVAEQERNDAQQQEAIAAALAEAKADEQDDEMSRHAVDFGELQLKRVLGAGACG